MVAAVHGGGQVGTELPAMQQHHNSHLKTHKVHNIRKCMMRTTFEDWQERG